MYRDIVRAILLGGQWGDADLLVGFWGLILAESVIFNDMSGTLILSKGRPQLLFVSNMIQALCMVPALWISSKYGFKALVITSCIVRIQLPVTQSIMAYLVSGIGIRDIFKEIKWYIIATAVMSLNALFVTNIAGNPIIRYASIGGCIVIYFGTLLLIPSSRQEIVGYVGILKSKIKK